MKFTLEKFHQNISDEDLIHDLKRVAKLLGKRTVKRSEYEHFGKYSISSFRYHFGTWSYSLKLAGLEITRKFNLTKTELLFNLKKVWLRLGRQPRRADMNTGISEFPWWVYRDKFGSFRAALVEFVKHATKHRDLKIREPFYKPYTRSKRKRTKRQVNYALRYKVLTRDDYTCVKCGSSPATEKGVKLEIDHIKPYSKGGETVMSNLQTLCRKCNIGKGNNSV
jgi:hypothetical protein